jgi:hypothetical protein
VPVPAVSLPPCPRERAAPTAAGMVLDLSAHSCYGPQVPQDDDQHRIVVPEGDGVYCWGCGPSGKPHGWIPISCAPRARPCC